MLTVGVDPHKRLLRAEALTAQGRPLASWEGKNTALDHAACLAWLTSLDDDVQVAIEGAYGYGRGLARTLVDAGITVFDINPRWTAAFRKNARRQHKNDPADARAAAQVLLRDGPHNLPRVFPDDRSAALDVLVREREALVAEMTRKRNRLHPLVNQLGCQPRSLASRKALEELRQALPEPAGELQKTLVDAASRLLRTILADEDELKLLTERIESLAHENYAPLMAIPGVGALTAATIASELGSPDRFTSERQLAAFAGVTPIEASSAGHKRHRLNRGGNRRLNAIAYRICLTQRRCDPRARDYIERRRSEGLTLKEAVRCLKRYIVRAVFHAWKACFPLPCTPPQREKAEISQVRCT